MSLSSDSGDHVPIVASGPDNSVLHGSKQSLPSGSAQDHVYPPPPVYKQKIREAEVLVVKPLPEVRYFRYWVINLYKYLAAASGRGTLAIEWIKKVESAASMDELAFDDPEWVLFSLKLSSALHKLITGELEQRVQLIEEKLMHENDLLNGRQLLWLVFNEYKRNDVEVGMTDFEDLMNLRIRGNNLELFVAEWDRCLFGMRDQPAANIKLSLFKDQVIQCTHFSSAFLVWKTLCTHQGEEKAYEKLHEYVLAHLSERKAQSITDQATAHFHTTARVGQSSASVGASGKWQKGDCTQKWKKGRCSRKNCPFNHDFSGRVPPEARGKASTCVALPIDESSAIAGAFVATAMQNTSGHSRSPLE